MKCGFCGKEIPDAPDVGQQSCGACSGGCRKVHCPHCGYANPVVSGLLRRLMQKSEKREEKG
ncbi:MAG: hypothetical protein WDA20_01125 [Desulfuromonadales bacterium]|jgi:hypothetical protein